MKRLIATTALFGILGAAASAFAHAEAPLARKIATFGDDAWLLRTNFGLISSDAPNQFVCEEAFLGGDRFFVAPLSTTSYVTFGETTIHATTDGCDFERVGDVNGRVEDVDSHVEAGLVAYIANGEGAGAYVSADVGSTFEAVGTLDTEAFQLTTVRFVDDNTLVVGAYDRNAEGAAALYAIDVATGDTTELTLPESLTYPYVIAAGAGRIVFNARSMVQTVFVGTLENPALHARPQEAGESWPTGAAISPDGSKIYLAGMVLGRGLLMAEWNDTDLSWTSAIDAEPAGCITDAGDTAYVCSSVAAGGNGDLVSFDGSMTTSQLLFSDIVGPVEACPADSDVGTVCPLVWPEVAPALGVQIDGVPEPDAGTTNDAGTSPTDDGLKEEGCATGSGAPQLLAFLALLIAVRRPRRKDSA